MYLTGEKGQKGLGGHRFSVGNAALNPQDCSELPLSKYPTNRTEIACTQMITVQCAICFK